MAFVSARDYQIAIPSYKRPELLSTLTLNLLRTRNINLERVTVFLHEHDPYLDAYRTITTGTGARLHIHNGHGVLAQRHEIARHYPAGTPVVSIDDDVTDIARAVNTKTLQPITDLHAWLMGAFAQCRAADLKIWGINPVANPFYMRPGKPPAMGLKFIIGTLFGFFSRPGHPIHQLTVPVKEDYEISLRAWWWDGGAIRFDDVTAKADHYTAPGGCQEYRDPTLSEQATRQLLTDWPGLVRRNPKRTSGHSEILLTPKKRHPGWPTTKQPPGITHHTHKAS